MRTTLLRAVLLALLTALSASARAQSEADYIKLVHAQAAAWSQGVDQLVATFTEDVVYEDVPLGLVNNGKEELRKFASGFFAAFPDLKSTITSIVISGNKAAFEWLFEGTQAGDLAGIPASNKRMSLRGVSVAEFAGGKVMRQVDYWDMATLLKQLSK